MIKYGILLYLFLFFGCSGYYETEEEVFVNKCDNTGCRKVVEKRPKKRWYIGIGGCSCMPKEERARMEEELRQARQEEEMLELEMKNIEQNLDQELQIR